MGVNLRGEPPRRESAMDSDSLDEVIERGLAHRLHSTSGELKARPHYHNPYSDDEGDRTANASQVKTSADGSNDLYDFDDVDEYDDDGESEDRRLARDLGIDDPPLAKHPKTLRRKADNVFTPTYRKANVADHEIIRKTVRSERSKILGSEADMLPASDESEGEDVGYVGDKNDDSANEGPDLSEEERQRLSSLKSATPVMPGSQGPAPNITRLSLDDAYMKLQIKQSIPLMKSFAEEAKGTHKSRKRARSDLFSDDGYESIGEKSDDSSESIDATLQKLAEDCGVLLDRDMKLRLKAMVEQESGTPSRKTKVRRISSENEETYLRTGSRQRDSLQREEDDSDFHEDHNDSEKMRDYVRSEYGDILEDLGVNAETFLEVFCPLCGMGNLRNEDSIAANAFRYVEEMAKASSSRTNPETGALVTASAWNSIIYRPMRAAKKRILPLTYQMALNHIKQPHQPDPVPDHKNDIAALAKLSNVLESLIVVYDENTGAMDVDPKKFAMYITAKRLKNVLRKTLPEKMAYYTGPTSSSQNFNPMRNVHFSTRRVQHSASSAHLSGHSNTSLGGRKK